MSPRTCLEFRTDGRVSLKTDSMSPLVFTFQNLVYIFKHSQLLLLSSYNLISDIIILSYRFSLLWGSFSLLLSRLPLVFMYNCSSYLKAPFWVCRMFRASVAVEIHCWAILCYKAKLWEPGLWKALHTAFFCARVICCSFNGSFPVEIIFWSWRKVI